MLSLINENLKRSYRDVLCFLIDKNSFVRYPRFCTSIVSYLLKKLPYYKIKEFDNERKSRRGTEWY